MQAADRIPPWDPEAETMVIGALLIGDQQAVSSVMDVVDESMFYDKRHRIIFKAAARLFDLNAPVEIPSIKLELEKTAACTYELLCHMLECLDAIPTAANAHWYAARIRESAQLRKLITAG